MWIGLLIFNLIIIYIYTYPSLVLEVWLIDASHDWRWWRIQSSHPFDLHRFPWKHSPTGSDHGWPWVCSETKCLRFRTNKAAEAGALFPQTSPKKNPFWMPVSTVKGNRKSHRKPLVGWLLMLTPLFLAKGDPHERLMVQVLISSSRLQRELRIAMGTPAATASRFSPPNSAPSKSKDCQQRRCKDR